MRQAASWVLAMVSMAAWAQDTAQQTEQRKAEQARQAAEAVRARKATRAQVEAVRAQVEAVKGRREGQALSYERARRALDERQWERAIEGFAVIIKKGDSRADGALYWTAYAQNKMGKRTEALATLAELARAHPNSRWLNDAKALEVEVRQAAGQPVSPESETDDDIKLIAISGLANTEPERAVPLLEKLLQGGQSPRLKERALYVLARVKSPRAKEIITQIARGGSNPDLQVRAVRTLGVMGKEGTPVLAEIYSSSTDIEVKRAALRGLGNAEDKDRIVAVAREEKNMDLRREAIHQLGGMGAVAELWQIYGAESSVEAKQEVLQALSMTHNFAKDEFVTRMVDVARSEKDPKLRRQAVRALSQVKAEKTSGILASLYSAESDVLVRRTLLEAFRRQDNAQALVDVARRESDPALKREAVRQLSSMKSKEATDYMLEILNK